MHKVKNSTRALIFGGLFFMIPLFIIVVLIDSFFETIIPLVESLTKALNLESKIDGTGVLILSVSLILLVCFIGGYLIEKGILRKWSSGVEELLFAFLPSIQMLKFSLIGDKTSVLNEFWKAILIQESDGCYKIAFITDETETHETLYVPYAPKMDSGEVRYYKKGDYKYHIITMKEAMNAFYSFGKGLDVNKYILEEK